MLNSHPETGRQLRQPSRRRFRPIHPEPGCETAAPRTGSSVAGGAGRPAHCEGLGPLGTRRHPHDEHWKLDRVQVTGRSGARVREQVMSVF